MHYYLGIVLISLGIVVIVLNPFDKLDRVIENCSRKRRFPPRVVPKGMVRLSLFVD